MEKWVLITGATSGIGWATAEAFAEQGFNLLLTGRRYDRLLTLQTMLKSKKPQMKIELAAFDLSDRFEVSQFFKEKKERLAKIPGIGEVLANEISSQDVMRRAEEELEFIQKNWII